MSDKQKIIDKINKLLSLADPERGGTDAERERATEAAQKLIFKHRIEMYELVGSEEESATAADVMVVNFSKHGIVEANFYAAIIFAFKGKVVSKKLPKGRAVYTYVFAPNTKDTVMPLADRLWKWLQVEQKVAKAKAVPANGNAFRRAFFASAESVLVRRIRDQETALYDDAGEIGTALVIRDSAAVDKKMREMFPHLKKGRSRSYGDQAGHAAGKDAGYRANISKGSITV